MKKRHAVARLRCTGAAALVALAFLGAPALARAQEQAAVIRHASELRESPADSGRVLAPLPAETAVTRTGERQGPWVRVRTAQGTAGWVHLFDIGTASAGGSGGNVFTGTLRSVQGLFAKTETRRATTPTSTIGIRGLGAEDIANAQPDEASLKKMQALRASESDARQFAREASLSPVRVDPLPVPARPQASTSKENLP